MNRRVLQPLLASAVVLMGAFFALITVTPSDAAPPIHPVPASESPEGPPRSTDTPVPVEVESPRTCADCANPGADGNAPRPNKPVKTPSASITSTAPAASPSSAVPEPGA